MEKGRDPSKSSRQQAKKKKKPAAKSPDKPSTSRNQEPAPGKSDDDSGQYIFIRGDFWKELCGKLACNKCGKPVSVNFSDRHGLAAKMTMKCNSCNTDLNEVFTSPPIEKLEEKSDCEPEFDVNKKVAKFFSEIGKTHEDMIQFFDVLGMETMSKELFEKYKSS